MRTVNSSIPVTLVMPSEYDIQLKLDGDNSTIKYREKYNDDVPEDMITRTIEMVKSLQPNCTIKFISSRELVIEYKSEEYKLVNALCNEFENLRRSVTPVFTASPIPCNRNIW